MRKFILTIVALVLTLSLFSQKAKDNAYDYLESIKSKKKLPGIIAAVSKNGKLIWSGSIGTMELDKGLLPKLNSVYRVGSVSKVITTAALMQMVKNGLVDLDDPIEKWIKTLPYDKRKITLRQLASHTSGIRHYNSREVEPQKQYKSASESLDIFINDPLQSEIGKEWYYTSYGTNLLAAVLEKASGLTFPLLLKKYVINPLKMTNTYAWGVDNPSSNFVKFYNSNLKTENQNISYKWAGGGLLSSVEDLVKFGNAHLENGTFFNDIELQYIFSQQPIDNGSMDYQGIGWRLDKLNTGESIYYHNGHISGGHAHISIQPKEKVVVVILSNKASSFGAKEGNELVNILLKRKKKTFVEGVEHEMQSFMKVFKESQATYSAIKKAFQNGDIEEMKKYISHGFKSSSWSNKSEFIHYLSTLLAQGGIKLDESDLDFKISGHQIGSRIELFDLKFSKGFQKNQTIVLRYDGKHVKIITVI